MSAKQVSLKSPVTIAVVVVLLGAVVFFNVKTFGGRGDDSSRGYRAQAHPPVPMDVGRLADYQVEVPVSRYNSTRPLPAINLSRDPFLSGRTKTIVQTSPYPKHGNRPGKRTRKIKSLQCSAIMLGGVKPMAIINGEGRYPGDQIRGMTLATIDADGVTLNKPDGTTTHLKVGVKKDKNASFRVVTGIRESESQGRTRLADQKKEGNPK